MHDDPVCPTKQSRLNAQITVHLDKNIIGKYHEQFDCGFWNLNYLLCIIDDLGIRTTLYALLMMEIWKLRYWFQLDIAYNKI